MPETAPLISVVIPLYNKAAYVVRAIESALAQGEAIREVVVVDDGSTDDSAARVEALAHPRVRLIRQANGGVSAARNRGIEAACGDYVAFLDADDVYLPGFADEIVNMIHQFPDAGLYATGFFRVWPDGRRESTYLPRVVNRLEPHLANYIHRAFSRSTIFSISSSACVRRQVFFRYGVFFPVGESVGEDQDVIFRLTETVKVAYSPKPLAEYTQAVKNSLYSTLPVFIPPCISRLHIRASGRNFPGEMREGAYRLVSVAYQNVARENILRGRRITALRLVLDHKAWCHWTYLLRTLLRLCLPVSLFKPRWLRRI